MEITSRNLEVRKSLKLKYQDKPQTETEKQTPQTPAFKGGVPVNGLKQLGRYGSAAMLMAGTMFMATSCEQTEVLHEETYNVYVQQKTEELEKLIQQLLDMNDKYYNLILDGQNKMISLLEQMNNANQANQSMILKIFAEYKDLLLKIKDNTDTNVEQTKQGLELYNQILAQITKNNELLNKYGNEIVSYLGTIKTAIESGNDSIIAVLELLWADVVKGNSEIFEAVKTLGLIMETNNDELVETILDIYENSELSAAERNQAVLDAINDVKATVDNFQAIIGATTGDISAKLQEFLDSYNKNEITSQKMMELMYNALIEGNTLSKLQLEQLHQIWVRLEGGDVAVADALKEIKALLSNIDNTLTEIKAQLKDVLAGINDINVKLDASQAEYASYLDKLVNNTNKANEYLAALTTSQKNTEDYSTKLIDKANEAIELLKNADKKLGDLNYANLIAELKAMDAELAAELEEMINNLGISINNNTNDAADQIIAALDAIKASLNANNADMKEVISQLSSLNLKADLNAQQMSELIKLVSALKATVEDSGATQDDISAKLDDIKEFLASIDNTLKDILATLESSAVKGNQQFEELKGILNKMNGNIIDLKANGAAILNKLDGLQAAAIEIIAYLEQIEANQGDDITYAQLKELSGENLAAIEKMLENLKIDAAAYADAKIGDLIAAVKSSNIDLTTTNNLLQTIITIVSKLNGSSAAGNVNTILQDLLNAYNSGNADLKALLEAANSKLDALYDQVVEIYNELSDLTSEFKTYSSLMDTSNKSILTKLDAVISDIEEGNSKLSALESQATVGNNYLNNALSKADEIIALLEQQGANSGNGLTKAELEEVLADAGASLQTMLNNLGISINDNTDNAAAEIVAAIKSNKVDLTTTHNLLQSIITNTSTLVKLASNSNVTVDTSALEAKLDSLISSGSASQSELEALNKAVQIELNEPINGIDGFIGILTTINELDLVVEYKVKNLKKKVNIPFTNIKKANTTVIF